MQFVWSCRSEACDISTYVHLYLWYPGEVTLDGFIAFAQNKTWGPEAADPFSATVGAGDLGGAMDNAVGADIVGELAEEVNSDGEDAR